MPLGYTYTFRWNFHINVPWWFAGLLRYCSHQLVDFQLMPEVASVHREIFSSSGLASSITSSLLVESAMMWRCFKMLLYIFFFIKYILFDFYIIFSPPVISSVSSMLQRLLIPNFYSVSIMKYALSLNQFHKSKTIKQCLHHSE